MKQRAPGVLDATALRYVVAVADAGSMTAAGKALGLSQPSITNAVQRPRGSQEARLIAARDQFEGASCSKALS